MSKAVIGILRILKNNVKGTAAQQGVIFSLYNHLVQAARNPSLYKTYKVPDTLDGRFEAIVLHIALYMAAAEEQLEDSPNLIRELVSVFLKDMDRSLREIGIGDLSVGKEVKKMATAFYGRAEAYKKALHGKSQKSMAAALKRNLYRDQNISSAAAAGLTKYALVSFAQLQQLPKKNLKAGKIPPNVFKN